MAGNAWEWTASGYKEQDPAKSRVLRGGSFYDVAVFLRAAYRYVGLPDYRRDGFGFRCAQDP